MCGNTWEHILVRMHVQIRAGNLRITQHAQQEMVEEDIFLDDLLETIAQAQILEDYPQHRRGACCLLSGVTAAERAIHVVCTTARATLIIITVYEPKLPKWVTPTQRSKSS